MKGFIEIIMFLAVIVSGCGAENEIKPEISTDLEFEIINAVLPSLLPEHPPCMPVPIINESSEAYELRLQSFYDEVDSVGKKIEILTTLRGIDPRLESVVLETDSSPKMKLLLRASFDDKQIEESMIHTLKDVEIVFVKELKRGAGSLTDCYTLGQISFARIGFNEDSTRAVVWYRLNNGSCHPEGDIIEMKRMGQEWEMVQ